MQKRADPDCIHGKKKYRFGEFLIDLLQDKQGKQRRCQPSGTKPAEEQSRDGRSVGSHKRQPNREGTNDKQTDENDAKAFKGQMMHRLRHQRQTKQEKRSPGQDLAFTLSKFIDELALAFDNITETEPGNECRNKTVPTNKGGSKIGGAGKGNSANPLINFGSQIVFFSPAAATSRQRGRK